MPRHRKSPTGELRDKAVRVHMSQSEQRYLQERAGRLSLSEYLLQAGLGQKIPQRRQRQRVPQLNRELLLLLGRIRGDLHQLAQTCLVATRQGQACHLDVALLEQLRVQLKVLSQAISGVDPNHDEWDEPS